MDSSVFERCTASSAISAGTNRISAYKIVELLRSVDGYHHPQQLAVETVNVRSVGSTQPDRAFGDGFKHSLKIECRAADNIEHLRGRCLLLQRFGKLAAARLHLVEQVF